MQQDLAEHRRHICGKAYLTHLQDGSGLECWEADQSRDEQPVHEHDNLPKPVFSFIVGAEKSQVLALRVLVYGRQLQWA